MDRETFEQLVSESLDRPERDDLRAAIEAAVADSPALARLRDEWLGLDRLLRGACPGVAGVDWPRFHQHITERLDSDAAVEKLDERLRGLTIVEQRVDWPRLRERISEAVADGGAKPGEIRFRRRRVGVGLTLLAAAAALVLMWTLPLKRATGPAGFVQVSVSSAAKALPTDSDRRGFARVSVSAPPGVEEAADEAGLSRSDAAGPQSCEVFLMVEPVRVAARTRGSLTPFGFN